MLSYHGGSLTIRRQLAHAIVPTRLCRDRRGAHESKMKAAVGYSTSANWLSSWSKHWNWQAWDGCRAWLSVCDNRRAASANVLGGRLPSAPGTTPASEAEPDGVSELGPLSLATEPRSPFKRRSSSSSKRAFCWSSSGEPSAFEEDEGEAAGLASASDAVCSTASRPDASWVTSRQIIGHGDPRLLERWQLGQYRWRTAQRGSHQ